MLVRLLEAAQVLAQAGYVRLLPRGRHRAAGRHLLIVSHDFPPGTVTGAQLPAFLARHAATRGWRVTVVCGAVPETPSPHGLAALHQVPASVRLLRAPGHFVGEEYYPRFPYRFSPHIDGGYPQQVGMTYAAWRGLRHDPPSHVFATGPTFNNFAAGRALAQAFRVPLVLQYRDEWTVMQPSYVVATERSREFEADCLRDAALVTFVTAGKLAAYREAFPQLEGKPVLLMPNGWDPTLLDRRNPASRHLEPLRGRLVLSFTGRVTLEIPITPFLDLLARVLERDASLRRQLVLTVAGDQRGDTLQALTAFGARFPGAVVIMPSVSQVGAMEIQHESTVLLLLNNTRYPGVVPLKTFDYMIAGTPILAFGTTGEAGRIVAQTGAGRMVGEQDADGLQAALLALAGSSKEEWNTAERRAWTAASNRVTLNDTLLNAIEALPAGG